MKKNNFVPGVYSTGTRRGKPLVVHTGDNQEQLLHKT